MIRPALLALAEPDGIKHWKSGDIVPITGRRILIGIMEACRYDFELLEMISRSDRFEFRDMFFVSDCYYSESEVEFHIPAAAAAVGHSPIGVWENGPLVAHRTGFTLRNKYWLHSGYRPSGHGA